MKRTKLLYSLWLILVGGGFVCMFVGIVHTFKSMDDVSWLDLLLFSVGFIFLLVGAINASFLDFIVDKAGVGGIFTDNNEAWATLPLFGLSFTNVAFILIVIIMGIKNRNKLEVQIQ